MVILKTLPQNLTSYDLLKALAVLLMVVDHTGLYLFPDEVWFRVVGRLSMPIWCFLIGYARTREVPHMLWIGAGVLVVSSLVAGEYIFPATILFTLAAARLLIDRVMTQALRNYETLLGMFFLLFFLTIPTWFIIEYGTLGLLFAMFGYMRRNSGELQVKIFTVPTFAVASTLVYAGVQTIFLPPISQEQLLFLLASLLALCLLLYLFKSCEYPRLTQAVGVFSPVIRLLGRRTLEIYVLHIICFRVFSLIFLPERFKLFNFKIMVFNPFESFLPL